MDVLTNLTKFVKVGTVSVGFLNRCSLSIMVRISVALPEPLGVKFARKQVCFVSVAAYASWNPVIRLMGAVTRDWNKMINFPCTSLADESVVLE